MLTFEVKDMTCGHCASTIARALKAIDREARVQIDLAAHRVRIEPTEADAEELGDAIKEVGHSPLLIASQEGTSSAPAAAVTKGCCCG